MLKDASRLVSDRGIEPSTCQPGLSNMLASTITLFFSFPLDQAPCRPRVH